MASTQSDHVIKIAFEHQRAGRLSEAEALYRQVLAHDPNNPGILRALGVCLFQMGRVDEAIGIHQKAIALAPGFAQAHADLGSSFLRKRDFAGAESAYRQAVSLAPGTAAFHAHLATALHAKQDWGAASAAYQEALRLQAPANGSIHLALGICLYHLERWGEAVECHRQAAALSPGLAEAQLWLGHDYYRLADFPAAIVAFRRAVELAPNVAQHHYFLGNALKAAHDIDAALACFRRAAAISPRHTDAINNFALSLLETGRLDEALRTYERILQYDPAAAPYDSNRVYALHFHPDYDARALLNEHRLWSQRHAEPLTKCIKPHNNNASEGRRLRIGYVSPDFRDHSVGRCLKPIIRHHDEEQVEIFCYSNVQTPDEHTEQFRKLSNQWRDIHALSDEQAAELIRADRIDILVDLSLHTSHNRLLVFARKPAPVQLTYLGYCSTTGLDAIDYRFSDPHLDPPDVDLSCYVEQTIRLPTTYWNFSTADSARQPGALPAMKNKFITFGCLNNFAKVSESALDLWGRVMASVKDSRLLLYCPARSAREWVAVHLSRYDVAPERLIFVGWQSWGQFMATYQQIDIALDTFPYGGGLTTCDSLWSGVPVVSLSGRTAVGRAGRSILSNAGLPELVAFDADAYVEKCDALARDLDRLQGLRASLRDRMESSPLRNGSQLAKDIEAAYRRMWHAWCQSH